jgi:hypothetical protein
MLLAVVLTVLGLGALWVYGAPLAQGFIPASWQQNKIGQVAVTGGLLLIAVLIVTAVLKRMHESAV